MKKLKLSLIAVCVSITSISIIACGNGKKANETVSNNSQSESVNIETSSIVETTQEVDKTTEEVVENNQTKPESADINESITNIESAESVSNETEANLIELDATKIYINDIKLDVSTWKDKTINQILDDIASTGLVYHTIYGTKNSDKLDTDVSIEEVKNAINDINDTFGILTIRFGDDSHSHCELLVIKSIDDKSINQLILTIKPTTLKTSTFYIANSKYNAEYLDNLTTEEKCKQFMEESSLFSKVGEDPVFGFIMKEFDASGNYEVEFGDALGYQFTVNIKE